MRFLQRSPLPMNLNRTVGLEGRPLSLDARCRAERLRFRRMISAEFNVILNNGGTPRKGASALHAEAVANTATAPKVHGINSGEKIGDCNLSLRSLPQVGRAKRGGRSEGGEAGLLSFVANQVGL